MAWIRAAIQDRSTAVQLGAARSKQPQLREGLPPGSGLGPLLFGACKHFADSYRLILIGSAIIPAGLVLLSLWADNPQRKHAVK